MNIALRLLVLLVIGTALLLLVLSAWAREAVGDLSRSVRLR